MGDLNLTALKSAVLRTLANVQADHPMVAAGDDVRCINDAANDLIRWYPLHFPEHAKSRSWTDGPTVAGSNKVALPDNLVVLERVVHSNGATITSGDWSAAREQFMAPFTVETIGLLEKSNTRTGFPTLWDRKVTELVYYPTTQAGFETTFRFYGISGETPLSAGGDTFRMHRDFDPIVVLLGASKLAMLIGYTERAVELETAARRAMTSGRGVVGREREKKPMTVTSALCPR